MRSYIRHPISVPIELFPAEHVLSEQSVEENTIMDSSLMNDVSIGGLRFKSGIALAPKSVIVVRIPLVDPPFETQGRVAWCRKSGANYDVGLQFESAQDAYAARMVEQICHIEHYRTEVKERDGRDLTPQEAALEWIGKYASSFPSLTSNDDDSLN